MSGKWIRLSGVCAICAACFFAIPSADAQCCYGGCAVPVWRDVRPGVIAANILLPGFSVLTGISLFRGAPVYVPPVVYSRSVYCGGYAVPVYRYYGYRWNRGGCHRGRHPRHFRNRRHYTYPRSFRRSGRSRGCRR